MPHYERPRDLAVVEQLLEGSAQGPLTVADDSDGIRSVYLATLPDGPLLVLEGTSALIWRQAQRDGDLVTNVAQQVHEHPTSIRVEVEHFVEALVARGLLERREG
jgi:Coenzyme PQQ synthesis protein D (PqqD)